uniref:Uncharacterized protein n=1 Tax=Glossina palpalis gambiensis TaxID=67801 RepID=A0A1B0B9A5_9MUSC
MNINISTANIYLRYERLNCIKFVSPLPFLLLVNYNSIRKENERNDDENNKIPHTTLQNDNNKCTNEVIKNIIQVEYKLEETGYETRIFKALVSSKRSWLCCNKLRICFSSSVLSSDDEEVAGFILIFFSKLRAERRRSSTLRRRCEVSLSEVRRNDWAE